ncbi:MAG: ATP-dependent Clp protease proteolytic subunit, partial [Mucilaginibacter polytrichastri]|nr:ATP-dependent Clp protease proteolytic subunit [Mucilaginibacter polytrichastri]
GAMILLSGKTVHAAKGSVTMLHNALTGVIGNSKAVRKVAGDLDIYDGVLGQLIADRTGKSLDDVKATWMNYEDNLMSAEQALADKLIDVVEDYEAEAVPENLSQMSPAAMADYFEQRPAAQFIANISAKITTQSQPTNTKDNMNLFGSDFPKLNALAKAPSATETDVVEANAELKEKGVNLVLITPANLTEAGTTADALANAITALKTAIGPEAKGETAADLITALVADRDGWKAKADEYGDQPGAKASSPITQKKAEGGEGIDPVKNEFETEFDVEIKNFK